MLLKVDGLTGIFKRTGSHHFYFYFFPHRKNRARARDWRGYWCLNTGTSDFLRGGEEQAEMDCGGFDKRKKRGGGSSF